MAADLEQDVSGDAGGLLSAASEVRTAAASPKRTSLARAPVREHLAELLRVPRYRKQWSKHVQRSSGEISFDAVAHVLAGHENADDPEWYRKYSGRVSSALKPKGEGPTWGILEKIMAAFGMTRAHISELRELMREADARLK
jgi:hypothetical protein